MTCLTSDTLGTDGTSAADQTLWWHYYGAEIDGLASHDDGTPAPAWLHVILGESTLSPDARRNGADGTPGVGAPVAGPLHVRGHDLAWLASFDHDPTGRERAALTPERYRD